MFHDELLDIISPRCCELCGKRLEDEEFICGECRDLMERTYFERQSSFNRIVGFFIGLVDFERAASWLYYRPERAVSRIFIKAKYGHNKLVCNWLGEQAAKDMVESDFFEGIDYIVPMPINWKRRIRRGYNQSEQMALGVSKVTGIPVLSNVVKRTGFKRSQTKLNENQLRFNVRNAFTLYKYQQIEGKHVLILDDIITTGASVQELLVTFRGVKDVRFSVMSIGITKDV